MGWKEALAGLLGMEVKLKTVTQTPAKGSLPFVATSSDGRALTSEWNTGKAIREGLKASTWVYTACRKISTAFASVPMLVEKRVGEEWKPDLTHPLQLLLDSPNPFMSRQDVMERWALHLLLGGNALWHKVLVQGLPVEVWPLHPDTITPIPSRANFVGGYEWRQGSDKTNLTPDTVLHWMFVDPDNVYWGLAPLKAAASAVDTDLAAVKWNRATLANDGKPPLGIFLSDSLDSAQWEVARDFIQESIDGNNVRKALIMGGASKAQPLSLNAAEMDFLESRKFGREEIGAVFGCPPVLMVAGESVTFANLDAAQRILWEDTVVPLLWDYAQGLSKMLAHWGHGQTHRVAPDLSGVRALQANLKTEAEVQEVKARTFKALVEGNMPPDTAALLAGFKVEPMPGGALPRQALPAAPAVKSLPAPLLSRGVRERKDKGDPDDVAERLARMDAWIEELRPKIAELLLEQGSSVASAYAAGEPWEPELGPDDWKALLEALHTAVIEAEGAIGYSALLAGITATGGGGTFDVLADGVVEWIDDHVGDMVKGITDTSKLALRAEIKAGVEAGESTKDIAKRIRALHEDWAGYRADRIARTETGSAFGAAHDQAARQIDVPMTKTWVATGDSRTRDEHRDVLNGQTVDIDEPFSNGAMTAPNGVNCRCVTIYQPKEGG